VFLKHAAFCMHMLCYLLMRSQLVSKSLTNACFLLAASNVGRGSITSDMYDEIQMLFVCISGIQTTTISLIQYPRCAK
jgi:hypothetical protein